MPRVTGQVSIAAAPAACFELVARPELWPRFNPFCKAVEVLRSEGNSTVFSFHHAAGDQWRSAQLAAPAARFSFVERLDPEPPVRAFQIVRAVSASDDGGCVLHEEVIIDLASEDGEDGEATSRIRAHMGTVHQHLKKYLESHASPQA
jgi:hypothetical protein